MAISERVRRQRAHVDQKIWADRQAAWEQSAEAPPSAKPFRSAGAKLLPDNTRGATSPLGGLAVGWPIGKGKR
jgi:hypothetical protein